MTQSRLIPRHRIALPALMAGSGVGALVAGDALVSHAAIVSHFVGSALRELDYVVAAAALLLALLAASCILWRERVWQHRTAAAVLLVMLTSHLTALAVGPLNPLIVGILLAVGVWLLDFLAGDGVLRPSAFRTLTVLFFACVLASGLGTHPSEVLKGIVSLVPKLVLAVVIAELLDNPAKVRFAIQALLWTSGLLALAGLAQVAVYYLFHVAYSLAEADYMFAATPFGPLLRATGFSRTANQYVPPIGVALVIAALLALSIAGWRRRAGYALLALLCAGAVALSVVRGMWVATAASLLLLPFLIKPRLAPLWLLVGLVAAIAGLTTGLVNWTVDTLASLSKSTLSERFDLVGAGLHEMLASLNGTGIDNFGPSSPSFERYPVHNAPVQAASELGAPGALVFAALLAWIGWRLWTALRRSPAGEYKVYITALFAGYVVLLVAVQAEPMAYSQFLWIYLGLAEAGARSTAPGGAGHG